MWFNDEHRRLKAELHKMASANGGDFGDDSVRFNIACRQLGINPGSISLADQSSLSEEVKRDYYHMAVENAHSDKRNTFDPGFVEMRLHSPKPKEELQQEQSKKEEQFSALFRRVSSNGL